MSEPERADTDVGRPAAADAGVPADTDAGWARPERAVAAGADLDGCVYVYDPTGVMRILNASASAIWRLCDGTRTVADVVGELRQHHAVTAEVLAGDVAATIAELMRIGLLRNA